MDRESARELSPPRNRSQFDQRDGEVLSKGVRKD